MRQSMRKANSDLSTAKKRTHKHKKQPAPKVHDACVEVLARGLWKPNGDEETEMMKSQKKRSALMKQGMAS